MESRLRDDYQVELSALELRCVTDFATVAVSSLTEERIGQSGRLLLTAVGRVENTGTRYDLFHRRLVSAGKGPILCEPIVAEVRLRTGVAGLKVYPVAPDGKRGEALPARYADGVLAFDIGRAGASVYYELAAE